jgi:hypothetical protein
VNFFLSYHYIYYFQGDLSILEKTEKVLKEQRGWIELKEKKNKNVNKI